MPSSPSGTPPGEAVRWGQTTGRCPTRCRCGVGAARKPSRCRAISQRRAPSTSPGYGAALSLAMTARDEAERERAADQARLVAGDYRDADEIATDDAAAPVGRKSYPPHQLGAVASFLKLTAWRGSTNFSAETMRPRCMALAIRLRSLPSCWPS